MAAPTSMPEMARRADDGDQPPPVSDSSPDVTEPPGLGVLLCADALGAAATRNADALASARAAAPRRVRRRRVETAAELMRPDPPGLAQSEVTGRYPNSPWPTPA